MTPIAYISYGIVFIYIYKWNDNQVNHLIHDSLRQIWPQVEIHTYNSLYACVCNGWNYLLHRSVICGPLIRDKLHLGTFPAWADILKDLLTHPANLHWMTYHS